ncbi:hypothetical protein [Sphingobium baderi]|uniref:hypothetical protein n=1 Tax=Sphingobium baderi TaxID=1332080 RepID=UPI0012E3BD81|nr:hypothetical protein [Sphingobium baderi]
MRGFVEAIVLVVGGAREIDVRGDLAGILSMALAFERKKPALRAGLGVVVFMWLREGDLTETDKHMKNLVCRSRWLRGLATTDTNIYYAWRSDETCARVGVEL